MRFALIACFLLCGFAAPAQQYNFRNWTIAHGLPQSKVNDILQDHRKQLWVATRGGISRFNGTSFQTYNRQQGLSSNNTSRLFQDSRKHIWVGSTDNGVTRYDGRNFTAFGTDDGLPPGGVSGITEDRSGTIWVATEAGIYTLQKGKFKLAPVFPKQAYSALHSTTQNKIWAGSTGNGLYSLHQKQLTHYKGLPSNRISAIYSKPPSDTVWIGTDSGAAYITADTVHILSLPAAISTPFITDFATDPYGTTWIALHNQGILLFDGKSVKHLTKANGLKTTHTTALISDDEGNIWIGTNGHGLQQYSSPWFVHFFELGDINEPHITALAKDTKGRVWLGTEDGDAAYMNNGELTWLEAKVWPKGTTLYSMWVISEQDVWVSTSQGAWNLTPGQSSHYSTVHGLPANDVYTVAADAKNKIWFATANGVAYYENGTIKKASAKSETIGKAYTLFRDKQDRLWAGADNGIYLIRNNSLISVPELTEQKLREVTAIAEDINGWLYFGGFNYGLLAYHEKTGRTRLITSKSGLPNEGIKSLYVDRDNNLWVGTNINVLKIDLNQYHKTGKFAFREYNSQDGFRGLEVSNNGITQTPDGIIWFGTTRGLTQYIPQLDRLNTATPELLITDLKLFMQPTDWDKLGYTIDSATNLPVNLRLPYNKNHLTFEFHGICLSGPQQVKYKYKLEGYDQQWSGETEQPFATYANLDPGTYEFKLRAQNNDGYWTQQPLTYTFTVVPPIWRREWFIGVLLVIITGAVISIVRLREQSLLKMNSLLDQRVKLRTGLLEKKNREKEMLLQEIHHRVKNNLQIVISMLNLQARHVNDPAALEVMNAIRSRVRAMSLLHERLYIHNDLEFIDLASYFREICNSLYAAYGVTSHDVELNINIPPTQTDIDTAITLGLIVNELISNSLKYAFAGGRQGHLKIELQQQNSHYTLIVSDNGPGLPATFDQPKSFGLKLVASLSKKLNGAIRFENNNGTKSILTFVLAS